MEYKGLFEAESRVTLKVNRLNMLNALERSVLICKDPQKAPVSLDIKDKIVNITARAEVGEVYDQVGIEGNGESLLIGFNANYLVDVLKNIDDDEVIMRFNSSLNPCIIEGIDRDDYKYLVLPTKL